jgi:tRNA A37 threonylcarbamoyladenosine modification protein TsaB
LLLQLPWKDGISLLDARGEKYYLGIFKNNKKIEEFKIISSEEIKKINKNKICIDYKNINIFNNLLLHIKNFKIIKPSTLLPLYIKPPI